MTAGDTAFDDKDTALNNTFFFTSGQNALKFVNKFKFLVPLTF